MRRVIVLAVALLGGCASLPPSVVVEESAWQVGNVLDAGQTVTIARNPARWQEVGVVTRPVLGAHPTEKDVVFTMAAYGLIHFGVTEWIGYESDAHPGSAWGTALQCWEAATLANKYYDVVHNHVIGIREWEGTR